MKRVFALIVLVAAMTSSVQAQVVKVGVKGGLDIVDMSFNEDVFKTDNKMGWFVGPTMQITLPVGGLGVDIAALYDVKKYDLVTQSKTEDVTQRQVLVPLNARLKLGLGSTAGVYVAAGPQFAFNIGDDYKDVFKDDALQRDFQLKKSNFSVNLGAGIYFSKHVEIGFAYNIAIGSTADASWKAASDAAFHKDDSKPKSWQISAAYFF